MYISMKMNSSEDLEARHDRGQLVFSSIFLKAQCISLLKYF